MRSGVPQQLQVNAFFDVFGGHKVVLQCHKTPPWIFNVCIVMNHLWFDSAPFQATWVVS